MKPFPIEASSLGPFAPRRTISRLKSSTALPNHIRFMRNEVIPIFGIKRPSQDVSHIYLPIINPRRPSHATTRCRVGLSNLVPRRPSFERNDTSVNNRTKSVEKTKETATKPEDVDTGESRKRGVPEGKAERSEME